MCACSQEEQVERVVHDVSFGAVSDGNGNAMETAAGAADAAEDEEEAEEEGGGGDDEAEEAEEDQDMKD